MDLIERAAAVRENAYAPYSNCKVGVALKTSSGTVYEGCNVENVAYPEGTCAEAGAIAAMVAAGETSIAEVAVIADSPDPVTPCGGCRQRLAEFCKASTKLHLCKKDGVSKTVTMGDMLPLAFDKESYD